MSHSETKKVISEHSEQVAFVAWFKRNFSDLIIFAIPNGGSRGMIEGKNLKYEGVLAGVPDLQILLPNGISLFIEMKNAKGKLSKGQKELHDKFEYLQFTCITAYSAKEASEKFIQFIDKYL
ncbi:VRR-NUC domain-containing protein [bacterium]|nr:VRR-NUC domain-containing protein [bacterium]MBU1958626.1 VRR-NUC domain-containing protein [bacterium]